MRVRALVLAFAALFAASTLASAQQQTGEIFGKATDSSGAVLPGVTVTLSAPHLLQPLTAITSETGTYQFPRLPIGTYEVKFELTGFKTVVNQDIYVTVGFSAQINAQLGVSTVQETITVTGESPVVDTRNTGTKQTFTNELLQTIPSARDPWVILQQTAGIAMDRENIGGNMSGQQSNYMSRGGNTFNNKWSLDGVDITDMAATGASPAYYDFDAFEEMTINTGGVDVTQQTGGVGINLVTKSGSDRFKGSTRFYQTPETFEANNLDSTLRSQGASSGNPIQDIKDYGVEAGGPLKKGRAWIWGSFGKQNIKVGVLGFYKPEAACQALKTAAVALAASIDTINDCLMTDLTVLQTTNLKAEIQLFRGNKLSIFNSFAKKERNARGASDLNPIETTTPQKAVPKTFGKYFWNTGPTPTYKFADQWVLSDRLLLDVAYTHVGNNFTLGFNKPELRDVQPTFIISTGLNGRSGQEQVFIRPVNEINVNANYFMPGRWGGDHAFKFGGYWKDAKSTSILHRGGFGTVRFPTAIDNNCALLATGCQVDLIRDGYTLYGLTNNAAFIQDTFTRGRVTANLGLRWDQNHDEALPGSIVANPLGMGQGTTQWLPGIDFQGADPGVTFNNISPRVGLSYDVTGNGKTLAKANFARYYGQVGISGIAGTINPVASTTLRYPWVDLNNDKVAQANEVIASANPLATAGNWSAASPAATQSANSVDPNIRNDFTDEFIVGFDREIGLGFAAGVNYIWRRYGDFQWSDRQGITSADWVATTFTPPAGTCPGAGNRTGAATCPAVTFYQPTFQQPTILRLAMAEGFQRTFNGLELMARKRLSHRWLMNTSFSYNSTIVDFGEFTGSIPGTGALSEDPTNRTQRQGFQYRLRDRWERHRQRVHQRQVSVQDQRPVSDAWRHQRLRLLQCAARVSAREHGPVAVAHQRRRNRRRVVGFGG